MTGDLLDTPDVAKRSGKSRATIWRWAHSGQIPAAAIVKFGRVVRFRPEPLIAAGIITAPSATHVPAEVPCDLG